MSADDRQASIAPSVSVVIPVLHDAARLARLLPRLPGPSRCEVIVANGDAADAGVRGMRRTGPDVVWVESEPGRGRQMNAGAARAAGNWLLFLHADALPDAGWVDEIGRAEAAGAVAGCFRLRIDASRWQARVIEAGVRWRVRWFGIAYGDQAIFVRRDLFRRLGGYRPIPVMEDAELVGRIRSRGPFWRSSLGVTVSARRWEQDGWWRRTAANLRILGLHLAGRSPDRLAAMYPAWRDSAEDGR
jgi:rSAM/selenodomain-associated transferase 2